MMRWAWCDTCAAYIGAIPPLLHPYWPANKSAGMHRAGSGHAVRMVELPTVSPFVQLALAGSLPASDRTRSPR